jgi:hypothetical protein
MFCEGPRRSRRALAIKLSVALLIGSVGVLLPFPSVTTERAMATETRRPIGEGVRATPAPSRHAATTSAPTQPARVRIAEDTRDFALIGVTLPDAPAGPVVVRTSTDGGAWSPWTELGFDGESAGAPPAPVPGAPVPQEPDEENPGAHSDPFWVGDASRYELELPAEAAGEAQVHLVYETSRQVAVAETAPAGADPSGPSILRRASWGARAPRTTPTAVSRPVLAIVHHTAGTNSYAAADVPALLRGVQAYHMDANGWNDIAYNFAVDRFGRVWEARAGGIDRAIVGAHTAGFNTGSTGVVVLGNFETAAPTSASVNAVSSVIAWKLAIHDVDPRTPVAFRAGEGSRRFPPGSVVTLNRIVGHRDVGLTACPGQNLYRHLGGIRSSVANAWPRLATPGFAVVGNFASSAADDVFLRQPGVYADRLLTFSNGRFATRAAYGIQATLRPVAGDFDHNGFDDIFWYAPGTAADAVWYSRGDFTFASRRPAPVNGAYRPFTGDFDADGDDDIFWYAPGSGTDYVWWSNGASFVSVAAPAVTGDFRAAAGDYDGDGDDDIFWHGPRAASDGLWVSSGRAFQARAAPQVSGSYVLAPGDYDGNGRDDIIFYAPGSPGDYLWLSQGGFSFASRRKGPVTGVYRVVHAADFHGDGRDELLWYKSPGTDFVWWHKSGILNRSSPASPPLR